MKPLVLLVLVVSGACYAGSDLSAPLREGFELARAGKWKDARAAFLAGLERAPWDKRYFIELAGLAYKTGGPAQAEVYLRRALALDPQEIYANDALGALHVLYRNLDAALWNLRSPDAGRQTITVVGTRHAVAFRYPDRHTGECRILFLFLALVLTALAEDALHFAHGARSQRAPEISDTLQALCEFPDRPRHRLCRGRSPCP
jgi:hypothetical protein